MHIKTNQITVQVHFFLEASALANFFVNRPNDTLLGRNKSWTDPTFFVGWKMAPNKTVHRSTLSLLLLKTIQGNPILEVFWYKFRKLYVDQIHSNCQTRFLPNRWSLRRDDFVIADWIRFDSLIIQIWIWIPHLGVCLRAHYLSIEFFNHILPSTTFEFFWRCQPWGYD